MRLSVARSATYSGHLGPRYRMGHPSFWLAHDGPAIIVTQQLPLKRELLIVTDGYCMAGVFVARLPSAVNGNLKQVKPGVSNVT